MKYILLLLLLASCSSTVYVEDCKQLEGNLYECKER